MAVLLMMIFVVLGLVLAQFSFAFMLGCFGIAAFFWNARGPRSEENLVVGLFLLAALGVAAFLVQAFFQWLAR